MDCFFMEMFTEIVGVSGVDINFLSQLSFGQQSLTI